MGGPELKWGLILVSLGVLDVKKVENHSFKTLSSPSVGHNVAVNFFFFFFCVYLVKEQRPTGLKWLSGVIWM